VLTTGVATRTSSGSPDWGAFLRCALKPIARRRETTVAAIALAWTRTWPCVTGAIVGAVTPEQINGWIGACRVELTSSDLDERRGYGRMRCLVRQIEKKVSWLKLRT